MPVLGAAATTVRPCSVRFLTTVDPMRPVPPINYDFHDSPFLIFTIEHVESEV